MLVRLMVISHQHDSPTSALANSGLYLVDNVKGKSKIRRLNFETQLVSTELTLQDQLITGLIMDNMDNLIIATNSNNNIIKLDSEGNQTPIWNAQSPSSHIMRDTSGQNLFVLSGQNLTRISMTTWEQVDSYFLPQTPRPTSHVCIDSAESVIYGYSAPNIWSYDLRSNRCFFLNISGPDQFFHPPNAKILADRNGCVCVWNSNGGRRLRPPKLPWKFARILWIGKKKNSSQECVVAKLPVEIIREIIGGWNHAYLTNY